MDQTTHTRGRPRRLGGPRARHSALSTQHSALTRRLGGPWGLLGAIALIAAVEGHLARHGDAFGLPSFGDWDQAGRAARREAVGADVLIFGDSMAKLGLQPRVMEPILGRKVRNLAVSAGPPPTSFFLLRRALGAGARPSAIVVDFHPNLLEVGPGHTQTYWPELLDAREAFDLARTARDADLFAAATLGRWLPSIRGRHEVRSHVATLLEGKVPDRAERLRAFLANWRRNRGAFVAPKNVQFSGAVGPGFEALFPAAWTPNPFAVAYARRFFALAEAHKIPVYWILPPFAPEAEARRTAMGLSARYDAFVAAIRGRYPTVRVVDARRSGYPAGVFTDPVHLDRQGSAALSADLAAVLATRAAGRVDLPPYRDRPAGVVLEDGIETYLALKAQAAGVRR